MKIMDLSGDDRECQIEAVINRKTKKTKQARLPFQTLSADSPVANKKRKSVVSPDCRNAKQPKVNTKENSFKISEKTETEDTVVEKKVAEEKEDGKISETEKETLKQGVSSETQDSKNKKSTPGKGSGKSKKSLEPKVQLNSLTQFFKKIDKKDSKEAKSETQTSASKNEEEEYEKDSNVKKKLKVDSKESEDRNSKQDKDTNEIKTIFRKSNVEDEHQKKETIKSLNEASRDATSEKNEKDSICKKKSEESNDVESKDSFSSSENDQAEENMSRLNGTENMDVDSDINLLSDDSHGDDEDDNSGKSDTDNKKTEHEDTDSKDDTHKTGAIALTPTRNKLLNSSTKAKKLTPKQIERKLEIQKKREMRERQRFEREKKLQEERESRKKEKEEKRREREEKEKLLKEQKRKEKELKELKKQAEIEQKQKEKEAKEEDRRKREEAKEEEKRRKEEEKLEAERKKLKAASNFVSFFVAKKPTETKPTEEESKDERKNFMPFEIKADMRVAPLIRRNMTESEKSKLDKLIISSNVDKSELYINEIKNKNFDIRKSGRTWPFEASDDVVIIEEEDEESSNVVQASKTLIENRRAKLLLFNENRRPPYWGTWRKKSKTINPRRPFARDTECFDYEVDSDEEWEEEEPGESLHGSDDEKEKDEENAEENEYDVDNDFMVPHGYLSEEEIGADEEDEEDDLNPEKQETKLKILGEQFEAERNAKTKKLKPKVIGCVWLNKNNAYPESTPAYTVQFLTSRNAWVREIPLTLTAPADVDNVNDELGTPSNKLSAAAISARKAKALEEAIPDLIRLLHGNIHNRGFLIKEFLEFWRKKKQDEKLIPKSQLHQKIREIAAWMACPEAGPMHEKFCWYVAEEHRIKYLGAEKLLIPNNWTYSLTPKRKSFAVEAPDKLDKEDKEKEKESEKEKKNVPLITQFTKTLTAEEKQKQLAEKPSTPVSKPSEPKPSTSTSVTKPTPPLNKPPKRASLISVPRGESFPKSPRVSLMDKFVTKDIVIVSNNSKTDNTTKKEDLDEDDCMIIDKSDEKIDVLSVSTGEADGTKIINESDNNGKSKDDQNVSMKCEDSSDKSGNESKNSDIEVIEI